jgi:hypothetical protein
LNASRQYYDPICILDGSNLCEIEVARQTKGKFIPSGGHRVTHVRCGCLRPRSFLELTADASCFFADGKDDGSDGHFEGAVRNADNAKRPRLAM